MDRPIVGITMGDASGIGPEISIKAAANSEVQKLSRPLIIGDRRALAEALVLSRFSNVELHPVKAVEEAKFTRGVVDVMDLANLDLAKVETGKTCAESGRAAVEYLLRAISLAQTGQIHAITTAPLNKKAMHMAGYKYEGHTQILAEKTKSKEVGMCFISDHLWVMLVTTHLPLSKIPGQINAKRVLTAIHLANDIVGKLRHKKPRIGVAGLNPHAGEGGIFGKEEQKSITPAVEEAQRQGIDVKGPLAPDAIFYLAHSGMFDIVVSMYHDQGLIPLKLLAFNRSVNVTVGLPIVRTSVDHGTGFDIAGKGWANPTSLIEAIKIAARLART